MRDVEVPLISPFKQLLMAVALSAVLLLAVLLFPQQSTSRSPSPAASSTSLQALDSRILHQIATSANREAQREAEVIKLQAKLESIEKWIEEREAPAPRSSARQYPSNTEKTRWPDEMYMEIPNRFSR